MAVLVARVLAKAIEAEHGVTYLPSLADAGPGELAAAVVRFRPRVLVTCGPIGRVPCAAWRGAVPDGPLILLTPQPEPVADPALRISVHGCRSADPTTVLSRAERLWALHQGHRDDSGDVVHRREVSRHINGQVVTLVGAGIVNLVSALQLASAGYTLRILDAGPDPRFSDTVWTEYGCTMAGHNARMFTFTEADVYLASQGAAFAKPASAGGWRVRGVGITSTEEQWLARHFRLPSWLAAQYAKNLYHFNRESGRLWQRLRGAWPDLFRKAHVRDGITRIYSSATQLDADHARHHRLHLQVKRLTPDELAAKHPALAEACGAEGLVSGALEVPGFTVAVHDLVRRLLDALEAGGAALVWGCSVEQILSDQTGAVRGLATSSGVITSDHYVVSPGMPRVDLLKGTASDGLIQGVLGVWLRLPNVVPTLTHSLKLAQRGHLTPDTNVTVGPDGLILGSGYGWTGARPHELDPVEVGFLANALHDTARRYFPRPYEAWNKAGREVVRFCVRPWTSSSLGIFEIRPTTANGVLVITGGHNTGGFAQSPAVASAVLAALRGRRHLMHALYHPQRALWLWESA